jgi:hypothetical protein
MQHCFEHLDVGERCGGLTIRYDVSLEGMQQLLELLG